MSDAHQPRIVAEGRWIQDEFGDTTYIPEHLRPSDLDPAWADEGASLVRAVAGRGGGGGGVRGDGYCIRSDDTWALAREDYLGGDTAEVVCARYDLKVGTLRHRARREGWRRGDAPDPEPVDLELEIAAGLPDLGDMARHALVRMDRAVRAGRSAEAASWLRICRELTSDLRFSILRLRPDPPAAADAGTDAASLDADDQALLEVAALARDAAALSPDDAAGYDALDARLEALLARVDGRPISDGSDHSDPVFSAAESEITTPGSAIPKAIWPAPA